MFCFVFFLFCLFVCLFFFFLIAKGLDRMVLATGLCSPTSVLGVHGINKNPIFISVPDFHGLTFRSGLSLKTLLLLPCLFFFFFFYF